jgi:hypothetical protein
MPSGHYPRKSRTEYGRTCSICNSEMTKIEKVGNWPHWYRYNGGWICRKCYKRDIVYVNNREKISRVYNVRYGPRKMYWAPEKRYIYLPVDPRTGICKWCNFSGYTHLHHEQYHLYDPTKGIVELCASCHKRHHQRIK